MYVASFQPLLAIWIIRKRRARCAHDEVLRVFSGEENAAKPPGEKNRFYCALLEVEAGVGTEMLENIACQIQ